MPHIKNALIRYRIIDKCIRNKYKPYPSKQDLREACEEALFGSIAGDHICDSTIEKDMFAMKMEHDAPIRYSKREGGYYYTDTEFTMNDIPLTSDDMEALSFAAKTLMQFKDVALFRQFGSAIDKIADRIELSTEENSDQFIQFESSNSESGSEFLAPLLDAIKTNHIVKFDYASFASGELKIREVLPLLLKQYRNRWYLISFDRSKNDFITYALDRMEDLEVTSEVVERPKNFNPDNFFKFAIGITSGNNSPQQIKLKTTILAAKYLDSLPLHVSQKVIEMKDDYFVFSLTVNISEELIREILSYGGEVTVLSPENLKKVIAERAGRLLNNH